MQKIKSLSNNDNADVTPHVRTTRSKRDSNPGALTWESGTLTRRLKTPVSSVSR